MVKIVVYIHSSNGIGLGGCTRRRTPVTSRIVSLVVVVVVTIRSCLRHLLRIVEEGYTIRTERKCRRVCA